MTQTVFPFITLTPAPEESVSGSNGRTKPANESTGTGALLRSRRVMKYSDLSVEVTTQAKPHTIKHFYTHRSDLTEPSDPPIPTTEPASALDGGNSTEPSPTPTPISMSLSPKVESRQVKFKEENEEDSMTKRKLQEFGYWIRLGESGFLKSKRKTY